MAKSFKDTMQKKAVNPTLQFITPPEEEKTEKLCAGIKRPRIQVEVQAPPAPRAVPEYGEETKSRRLQLLLTPSLYDAVKEEAAQRHTSVNELINIILKDATRK